MCFPAYSIIQKNHSDFRTVPLEGKKQNTSMLLSSYLLENSRSTLSGTSKLLPKYFFSAFLFPPVDKCPKLGVECGHCAARHLHSSAICSHISCPLRAMAGNQRQELCLWLDLTGSKSLYKMSLKFLCDAALCPASANVKLPFLKKRVSISFLKL